MEAIALQQQAPSIQLKDMKRLASAQQNIAALKESLKAWQQEYDAALSRVLETATFSEDKFLRAIKRKGDCYREGNLKLIRTPTVRRTIRRDEFVATYPEIFNRIGTVPIREAEAEIGKKALDVLCNKQTSYSYEVVDMGLRSAEERQAGLQDSQVVA